MTPPRAPLMPLDDALARLLAQALPLPGVDTMRTFDADGRVVFVNKSKKREQGIDNERQRSERAVKYSQQVHLKNYLLEQQKQKVAEQ